MMFRYLLVIVALMQSGCTRTLLSDKQLAMLSPTAKESIEAKQIVAIRPSGSLGDTQRWVNVDVMSAELLVDSKIAKASGQSVSVQVGKCGSILIRSAHDASILQVCHDGYQIRLGTGTQELVLHDQAVWANGMVVKHFLTEEPRGIYSLTMRIKTI